MKIQRCSIENNNSIQDRNNKNTPTFKAGIGDIALNIAGNSMQWIQDKGFSQLVRTYPGEAKRIVLFLSQSH